MMVPVFLETMKVEQSLHTSTTIPCNLMFFPLYYAGQVTSIIIFVDTFCIQEILYAEI